MDLAKVSVSNYLIRHDVTIEVYELLPIQGPKLVPGPLLIEWR